jgi:hypothetical protein
MTTPTDRELLEAAARAVGLASEFHHDDAGLYVRCPIEGGSYWNPLADDGDALRLLVNRRIQVEWTRALGRGHPLEYVQAVPAKFGHLGHGEPVGDDAGATLRRLIVRAAAALDTEAKL